MSKTCNVCGKEIQDYEVEILKHQYGYFSKRDTEILELVACPECLEKLTVMLINTCKINPIKEYTGNPEDPYGDKGKRRCRKNNLFWEIVGTTV